MVAEVKVLFDLAQVLNLVGPEGVALVTGLGATRMEPLWALGLGYGPVEAFEQIGQFQQLQH